MAKGERKYYHYQYDSTAKAYQEKIEPLHVPRPAQPTKKTKAQPRRKVDTAFGFQLSVCGLIIFSSALFYVYNYAALRMKQTELKTMKNEKIMINNYITEVQAKIDEKLDLSIIEEKASKELGMTKPSPHQIVYIELPERSYTVYEQTK